MNKKIRCADDIKDGDIVRVESRETPMRVTGRSYNSFGYPVLRAENHHGKYSLTDLSGVRWSLTTPSTDWDKVETTTIERVDG